MKPTRCCVLTQRGTRCANEPSPVRPVRMIGPVRLAACGLEAHQRALWSLPGFVRHDAYCGAFGCDRPSNAGICQKHRDMYRDFGITEYALLAQEAPMTEPTITPAPADDGEPSVGDVVDAQPMAPDLAALAQLAGSVERVCADDKAMWSRYDNVTARLVALGYSADRYFQATTQTIMVNGDGNHIVVPTGANTQSNREEVMESIEAFCDRREGKPEPSTGGEAPLFVGGTDAAPAELVARWGQVHTAPVQPMSADLDGLAAIAARGQQPTAPGSTVAELHAVCLLMQRLGSYGPDASAMLMRLLPVESRRALLEIEASDARGELARARANVVNPPPPERVAELTAKVATLDARIAALDAEKVQE